MKKNFFCLIFLVLCMFFTTASMWNDIFSNNEDNDNNEYVIKINNKTTNYLLGFFISYIPIESNISIHDLVYHYPGGSLNSPVPIKSGESGTVSFNAKRHIGKQISFPIPDVALCLADVDSSGQGILYIYVLSEKKDSFEKNYYNGHPICEYPLDVSTHVSFTNNNREMDLELSNVGVSGNVPL